jgi:hypothetical protein
MATSLSKTLASVVKGDPPEVVRVHSLNIRVPLGLLADIDVMCQRSGRSRNAICNELLAIGIADVLSHFEPEDRAAFQHSRDDLVHGYLEQAEEEAHERGEWGEPC